MDINPWTRGHAVVIPREHTRNLYEIGDEDLARTVQSAKRLALQMRDGLSPLTRLVQRLEEMPFPTLSSVHALCLTAGFELSLGCDLIFAAESARFGLVERVVGLTPGAGGTQRVAERAGPARAREFVMSGDLYDAATLERWNVINRV